MFGVALPRLSARFAVRPPALPAAIGARPAAAAIDGPGWRQRDEAIMGTAIAVELWSESAAQGDSAIDAVMAEMHRIDRAMSPHKADSELSRINRDAGRGAVAVSAEMATLLARAQEFARRTNGAFDITYAAVGRLYDYRRKIRPDAATLERARAAVGWRHLDVDAKAGTVRFAVPGMCIDLGGFAKGHAVDNAAAILARHGIRHANVAAGGDSRVVGDRRGRPWTIGIRDPRRSARVVAMLPLEDVSVSTSGDYERCFDDDGERVHHLIDPATGKSPDGVRSVTVLGENGLVTEALSKAVFVLGVERGLALVEAERGVDAVVVDAQGSLHHSSGFLMPASRGRR